jgi:hypothetical protein
MKLITTFPFEQREPIRRAWKSWLGGFVHPDLIEKERIDEDRRDERVGG